MKRAWLSSVVLAVGLGCARHVWIGRDPKQFIGPAGTTLRCPAGGGACTTDPVVDAARWNQSRTARYQLPQCPAGIEGILIENADCPEPNVVVQCVEPGPDGLGTMLPDGGVR